MRTPPARSKPCWPVGPIRAERPPHGRGRDRHDRVPDTQALVLEGMEAALQRKPRPPKLDGVAQTELVRLTCLTPPPGRARWTLKLLAAEMVDLIAPETGHRAL